MRKLLIILALILVAVGLFYFIKGSPKPAQLPSDYKNAAYQIEDGYVQLKDGVAEIGTADTATKTTTRYFGNEATGDFDGNGHADVAFLLTQDAGGTGTFFYIVAALNGGTGYAGTNGIFLGDRIAPQATEYINGEIIVNYMDRKGGDPFSTAPSVAVSRYFKIVNGKLVEIVKEGAVEGAAKG